MSACPVNTSAILTNSTSGYQSPSEWEIAFIAACTSFFLLVFLGLFDYLKIHSKIRKPTWIAPPPPNISRILNPKPRIVAAPSPSNVNQAAFPPQNRYYPIVLQAYSTFLQAVNGTERDGWSFIGEKRGVKKYKKDIADSSSAMYRGEKILPFPSHILIRAIRVKATRLGISDGQMLDCGPLEVIDDNCSVQFEAYKNPAPFVSGREMVYIDTIHRLHDGTIVSFAKSVEHPMRPKSAKFVRALLHASGWAFKRVPGEPDRTKVIYLVRCDLGGSLPSSLLNQIASNIPMTVERLNVYLKSVDISQFDQPLYDVLKYGPQSAHNHNHNHNHNGRSNLSPKQLNLRQNRSVDAEENKYDSHEMRADTNANANADHNIQYRFVFPQKSDEQRRKIDEFRSANENFFHTRHYRDLIPKKDKQWIYRPLKLIGGTHKEHGLLLDSFKIPGGDHRYKNEIVAGMELWHTWRKWRDGYEWQEKAQKEDMKIYTHAIPNEAIAVLKGEAVIPFSSPIVCGLLLNQSHRKKWDMNMDKIERIGPVSDFAHLAYVSIKTPMFITYRDMVLLAWVFPFPDGSLILGSRSVVHEKYPPRKTHVRATVTLNIWHIRPDYKRNIQHSRVTYYGHVNLGGSLPSWLVNQASIDMPSSVLKVRTYMQSIAKQLPLPETLHVPPYPMLPMLGIDVGWMMPAIKSKTNADNNNNNSNGNADHSVRNAEEDDTKQTASARVIESAIQRAVIEIPEERENIPEAPAARPQSQSHPQLQPQQQPMVRGRNPAMMVNRNRARSVSNASNPTPSVASSQRMHPRPNAIFMRQSVLPPAQTQTQARAQAQTQPARMTQAQNQQRTQNTNNDNGNGNGNGNGNNTGHPPDLATDAAPTKQGRNGHITPGRKRGSSATSQASLSEIASASIILTREEWNAGRVIRLPDITVSASMQANKRLLNTDANHNESDNNTNNHDRPTIILRSTLSVRDIASYMTLANCAVSDLLQQSDPLSKQYWLPSDTTAPRGIFIYQYIHSREKYFHFMGKAILHHEPKFIYDALSDPSFRFAYDKMCDSTQIIEKLDENTYIARYTHTARQCYIKQKREAVVVVRHRTVCPNDKYVLAGMSVEHPLYPTKKGLKVLQEMARMRENHEYERREQIANMVKNDQQSSHSRLSRQDSGSGSNSHTNSNASRQTTQEMAAKLTGKGPSKSINTNLLRVDIRSTGWVVERNVKKPSDSIVSYIINMNFGGNLPSALTKTVAKKQPLAIYYLGKALKKRKSIIRRKMKERQRLIMQQAYMNQNQAQLAHGQDQHHRNGAQTK